MGFEFSPGCFYLFVCFVSFLAMIGLLIVVLILCVSVSYRYRWRIEVRFLCNASFSVAPHVETGKVYHKSTINI